MTTKEEILNLLSTVKREGMENLIKYLNESDFFTAPASTKFHNNFEGGLADHSLSVYKLLDKKVKDYSITVPEQSVILCGILHDLCKVDTYGIELKWKKDDKNKWIQEEAYVVHDNLALGHGEKSCIMIQRFIQLTDEELLTIRWHMGMSDPSTHFQYPNGHAFKESFSSCQLLVALSTADVESSFIFEKSIKPLSTAIPLDK